MLISIRRPRSPRLPPAGAVPAAAPIRHPYGGNGAGLADRASQCSRVRFQPVERHAVVCAFVGQAFMRVGGGVRRLQHAENPSVPRPQCLAEQGRPHDQCPRPCAQPQREEQALLLMHGLYLQEQGNR